MKNVDAQKITFKFENEQDFIVAKNKLDKLGISDYEIFAPYSLENSLIIPEKSASIPILAFLGGIIGYSLATWFQYWTATNYMLKLGGKAGFDFTSSIPFSFEIAVLFSAIFIFSGFLIISGVWKNYDEAKIIDETKKLCFIISFSADEELLENEEFTKVYKGFLCT